MTTNKELDQKSLEKYLWGAATLLRGTIILDYKQYIFPLLFFKRIWCIWWRIRKSSSKIQWWYGLRIFVENHHFQPHGAHWKDVRETSVNIGLALKMLSEL